MGPPEWPGTAALALGDTVELREKKERLARLQQRQKNLQAEQYRRWIGREVEVLVQGPSRLDSTKWASRSPENRVVHFQGETAPGRLERVRILGATAYSLQAEIVPGFA